MILKLAVALIAMGLSVRAQQAAPALTIAVVVESALRNYPAIRVSQEQINSASDGIRLARTAYLPRIDTTAQMNRATRNNIFGLTMPQNGLPSISGPVLGTNNFGTVWGSAVGGFVAWEPFDFGLRQANVDAAAAARTQSEATLKRTQYEVAVAAADAFLTLDAAQEAVRAAQAGVNRADIIVRTTAALVNAELRPGADQSRAEAELAAARTQLIQAQQAVQVARSTISQFVAIEPSQISISAARLIELPPAQPVAPLNPSANPVIGEQDAVVARTQAELRALERSYFPRFYLEGAAYARGSGAETDGRRLGGLNGLAPNVQNYALGFTVNFPVMDYASLRARQAEQSATIRAAQAKSQQLATDLRAQWNRAVASLNGARNVAANTPAQIAAARTALDQANARYQSGLGVIDAVAEAQRLLTQAEIDDALARLSVWRGLLGVAAAAGDIQPFLAEASQ
jgi:outer membrane protein TolC